MGLNKIKNDDRAKMMVVVATLPLPRDGAWRKTIKVQKLGNSPSSGPEVVQRQKVVKEKVAQRFRSWTVHNEMRGVLGGMAAGAA